MKKRLFSALLATVVAVTAMPGGAIFAEGESDSANSDTGLDYSGYTLKLEDEFDGKTLNRDVWNVETHEPGWVNSELQEYVDSEDNIYLEDGKLVIKPIESVTEEPVDDTGNIITDAGFTGNFEENWEETIANWDDTYITDATRSISDGKIVYDIKNPGTEDWHVQLKHKPISLVEGKTYVVSYKVTSTAARTVCQGVQSAEYAQYGQQFTALEANKETTVTYEFTQSKTDDAALFYFSLGKIKDVDTPASVVTISDISLTEKAGNILPADAFGVTDGVIIEEVTAGNMGANPWDLAALQENINLEEGDTYEVTFTASSTVPRKIESGLQKRSGKYDWYGGKTVELTETPTEYSYEVKAPVSDSNAGLYFNFGKIEGEDTPESTVTVSDVKLVKTATASTKVTKTYTSGRISTQNKETFTYGRFEARVKVPKGQGFLPAFWLMANDENIYGQWPRCGEIDCMEVMGQDTKKAYGTIHYGNPHSESQGTYTVADDKLDFSDDFHTFTCDWEPGKITWYVDGIKFHEESDWYSTTEGQGTLTYPAPFDQPFYIILNLAVGGSWVGNPDENTSFEDNNYEVDYVRVYQKDSYDENVERPVKDVVLRDPDENGNYINNGDFSVKESLTDEVDWAFMTANGGEATAEIDDNGITIKTTADGTVDYSVQLVQAGVPLKKGAKYQVQFDAWASEDREMGVDVKAPDYGYKTYMDHQTAILTTEKQTYTYEFKMGNANDTTTVSDANGRLEYNMGATGSTADIHISNVSIRMLEDADPNEKIEKTVLANGNYVYNGGFQEGKAHMGYWTVSNTENASISVTDFADGRRLKVAMNGDEKSAVVLSQEDLAFKDGSPYRLSFEAQSDKDNTLTVSIGGETFTADIKAGEDKKEFVFEIPSDVKFVNRNLSITFGTEGTTYLDNVKFVENALIKNGSFNDGTSGFEIYVDSSAKASYVVDSLKDDKALAVTINNTGDADWKIQIKQNNVPLEKGKTYKLSFRAKSSLERQIRVVMQGLETREWDVYSSDNVINLTNEWQTFTDTFKMEKETDKEAFFSACLGMIGDSQITDQHEVRIDDIILEEVKDEAEVPDDDNKDDSVNNPGAGDDNKDDSVNNPGVGDDKNDTPATKPESKVDWAQKITEIKNTADKTTIVVNMGAESAVSKDAIGAIKGTDKKLVLDMGDGIKWIIKGSDVDKVPEKDIDMSVEVGTNNIPKDVIKDSKIEKGAKKLVQISLAHDGEFGFKPVLSIEMGKEFTGKYANLFYYNETTKKLEGQMSVKIANDGTALFEFKHASDYVVTVTDDAVIDTKTSVKTGDNNSVLMYVTIMGAAIALFGIGLYRKKRA